MLYHDRLRVMSIVFLAVGVALELVGVFVERKRLKLGIELIGIAFFLALAGAEYVEYRYEKRADQLKNEQVANLQKALRSAESTAEANNRELSDLRNQVKKANEDATRSSVKAEEANRVSSEVRSQTTPRRLTPKQRQALGAVIQTFPRSIVAIEGAIGDPESIRYSQDFVDLFAEYGHPLAGTEIFQAMFGPPFEGVQIYVHSKDDSILPFVAAFKTTLKSVGIDAQAGIDVQVAVGKFAIRVGNKPRTQPSN